MKLRPTDRTADCTGPPWRSAGHAAGRTAYAGVGGRGGILSGFFSVRDRLRQCRGPVRRGAATYADPRETVRAFEDDAGNTFLGCDREAPAAAGAFDSGTDTSLPLVADGTSLIVHREDHMTADSWRCGW